MVGTHAQKRFKAPLLLVERTEVVAGAEHLAAEGQL